ncbi:hypothetical protein NBRC110019_16310 [Neptunitalea chrysea]|uniref:Uncharacterized protein n=1 Tax=Neptunitalea chrysea TaxID=1647581 RepID=A0A9W6B4H9_9FLAO|nr:hypothetical protein [Neptunitalea chrysea]GLB52591.1 hypothetical protein NBRC110019_16310 [Neptunitalea chrysea]
MKVGSTKNNLATLKALYITYAFLLILRLLVVIGFSLLFWTLFDTPEFQSELIESGDFDSAMLDAPIKIIIEAIFAVIFVVGLVHCILNVVAVNYIDKKKGQTFIFIVGILNLFSGILGIGLGVFTIIEITRPHVKEVFEKA